MPVAGCEGGSALLLHFGGNGALERYFGNKERRSHGRVVFEFGTGELHCRDMGKLGHPAPGQRNRVRRTDSGQNRTQRRRLPDRRVDRD